MHTLTDVELVENKHLSATLNRLCKKDNCVGVSDPAVTYTEQKASRDRIHAHSD
jgi:hypothetical protein